MSTEIRKNAEEAIKERNEASFQHLVHLQGKEIKSLESEKVWIDKERARDVQTMNEREIFAINQRYVGLRHELARRHNTPLAKLSRAFGGDKRQQARLDRLNPERNETVTERTEQHVNREGQRQRSADRTRRAGGEGHGRGERAPCRCPDDFRQQRERSSRCP